MPSHLQYWINKTRTREHDAAYWFLIPKLIQLAHTQSQQLANRPPGRSDDKFGEIHGQRCFYYVVMQDLSATASLTDRFPDRPDRVLSTLWKKSTVPNFGFPFRLWMELLSSMRSYAWSQIKRRSALPIKTYPALLDDSVSLVQRPLPRRPPVVLLPGNQFYSAVSFCRDLHGQGQHRQATPWFQHFQRQTLPYLLFFGST